MLIANWETNYIFSGWGGIIGIFFLLIMSAFFSGSETALTASSRARLRNMTDRGSKGAKKALEITTDNESLIGTILLGNNVVNIFATSLATTIFVSLFGEKGIAYATIIMTMLILIFAELLPKTYAINNPESAARRVAPLIAFFVFFFSPVIHFVRKIVQIILSLTGLKIDPNKQVLALEEIAGAIALHHSEGAVKKDARDRLLGVLDLPDRVVEEIMLHRSQIEMVDADDSPKKILQKCLKSPYTRIPIFKNNQENVVGVLHAKDLLRKTSTISSTGRKKFDIDTFDIMKVAMKPYFIPETTTLDLQMRQFLKRKAHFALVVDEYGDLRGLITLEDIIEEIIGEITDEHDVDVDQMVGTSDGNVIVDGGMSIRDLNRAYDWSLPDNEANTIAGLVIHEAQLIPVVGQVFNFYGFKFEILEKEKNKIVKIKLVQLD
ncbi:MAG: HlyC/CorC family transporter [Paracoccaceae bacterium]|nr:HlyC/CorC family transporter [Paracoccaceae bacterium]